MNFNSNLNTNSNTDLAWKALMFFCVCGIILGTSNEVFASSDVIGTQMCTLIKTLSGATAKGIATVAIIGVAGGLLMGKLQWTTAIITAIGIILIFSAGSIVSLLGGGSGVSSGTNCSAI